MFECHTMWKTKVHNVVLNTLINMAGSECSTYYHITYMQILVIMILNTIQ